MKKSQKSIVQRVHRLCFLWALVFGACTSSAGFMTMYQFEEIPIGTKITALLSTVGKPTSIRRTEEGFTEYEYIERIYNGNYLVEERHYFFTLDKGKVVSRRLERFSPLPADEDVYDEQVDSQEKIPEETLYDYTV